ncbi:MAG: alpha/beta fold hydrolase [Sciscionella sp.]
MGTESWPSRVRPRTLGSGYLIAADLPVHRFPGCGGLELIYRGTGQVRPLVLLHGLAANGLQWCHHGPAAAIAGRGHSVILPDLRSHGESARPHDPVYYPPDVLVDDGLALIDWLGLDDYDLGSRHPRARVTGGGIGAQVRRAPRRSAGTLPRVGHRCRNTRRHPVPGRDLNARSDLREGPRPAGAVALATAIVTFLG